MAAKEAFVSFVVGMAFMLILFFGMQLGNMLVERCW